MSLKLRQPKARREIHPDLWLILIDQPDDAAPLATIKYWAARDCAASRDAWDKHHEAVLAYWLEHYPGTRPTFWWIFTAPELRRRLGGTGTPLHEVINYSPAYAAGVCSSWATVDPTDPPRYESQFTFLKRHGLLTPGERGSAAPETIADIFGDEILKERAP